jgi:hypothetical protein
MIPENLQINERELRSSIARGEYEKLPDHLA